MKQLKAYLLLVSMIMLLIGNSYAQDNVIRRYADNDARWNRSSVVFPSGQYVQLPQKTIPMQRSMEPRIVRTPYEVLVVNPNIQVLPNASVTQSEVPLVICKQNPNLMFGSANAVSGSTINDGSYISTNGGVSWFGTNTINNGNTANQRGDPGPAYDKNQRVIFTHLSSASNFGSVTGMAAEYSTDFGQTFSASFQVHSGGLDDKNLAGTDNNPSSPFYGNSYMAFCNYSAGTTYAARTTNGGVSWDPAVSWAPPGGEVAQGHDVDVCPNGTVIVAYTLHGGGLTENEVGVGRSTDGGVTYSVTAPAYNVNGTRSTSFNGWGIRTNGFARVSIDKSGGARNGWIYIVTDEANLAPAGSDADVIIHRSTDNGVTWSAGIRVNQDPLNNGKVQFFPCVSVDPGGGVNVAYYDNRNFPSVGDSCSVFISRSLDGGNSWFDLEVADHHFRPKPVNGLAGGYMGDYIGVASTSTKVWAFWMDDKPNSPGQFNAWAGWIAAGAQPQHDIVCGPFLSLPSLFMINNPYPIKTRVTNAGAANETGIPIKFFINGTLTNTTNINLNSGASDSVSNTWTPTVAGTYTLTYCSALANDTNRTNDTVKTTVTVFATLPGLCEGFNGSFPPTGWTNSNATLIFRATQSGFTLGTGSAYFDFWNVAAGQTGDLTTTSFPASSLGDSLEFDLAHCPFGVNDEIDISTSTNGGSTFTTLFNMTSVYMQTTTGCTRPFVPSSAGQWGRRSFVVPTGTNTIRFHAISQFGDGAYIDSVCVVHPVGITQHSNEIPKTYSLSQNYPNPFNPSTLINYALPKAGNVELRIYDLQGREVAMLVNGFKQAGNYSVEFKADNFASGVYFYKLKAGDFTSTKKMLLVK